MRVLFDIVHPAHVHFFKHMLTGLAKRGHETRIVARENLALWHSLGTGMYLLQWVCAGGALWKLTARSLGGREP